MRALGDMSTNRVIHNCFKVSGKKEEGKCLLLTSSWQLRARGRRRDEASSPWKTERSWEKRHKNLSLFLHFEARLLLPSLDPQTVSEDGTLMKTLFDLSLEQIMKSCLSVLVLTVFLLFYCFLLRALKSIHTLIL